MPALLPIFLTLLGAATFLLVIAKLNEVIETQDEEKIQRFLLENKKHSVKLFTEVEKRISEGKYSAEKAKFLSEQINKFRLRHS